MSEVFWTGNILATFHLPRNQCEWPQKFWDCRNIHVCQLHITPWTVQVFYRGNQFLFKVEGEEGKKKNPFPSRRTSACPQCPSQARPETPSTPLTPPTQVVMDTERVGTSSQKSPSRHPSAITKSIPVTNPHSQRCPFCPQALLLSSLSRILSAGSGTGTVPQLGGQSRVPVLNLTPELPHPS